MCAITNDQRPTRRAEQSGEKKEKKPNRSRWSESLDDEPLLKRWERPNHIFFLPPKFCWRPIT